MSHLTSIVKKYLVTMRALYVHRLLTSSTEGTFALQIAYSFVINICIYDILFKFYYNSIIIIIFDSRQKYK